MKKFLNSYRIIGLLTMIGYIINGVLHYYSIITIKEYYAIFGLISLLMIISYLINYISDITKITKALKEYNDVLVKTIGDSILINNYLINLCSKGYEYIEHVGWRYEFSEFVRNITKRENQNSQNNQNIKAPVDLIKELKTNLKYFEDHENFEECRKILEKIKQLENNKL